MLRSLVAHHQHPHEPELVRLCHLRAWDNVVRRCQSHPGEASASDANLRGEGSTALAAAVRCGAPWWVAEAVATANPHQLAVTHRQRGSVLHDALQHRCSDDVLSYLLSAVMDYQRGRNQTPPNHASSNIVTSSSIGGVTDQPQFKHVGIQEQRFLNFPNLFATLDDMNRTALHLLVERARRLASNSRRSEDTYKMVRTVVLAYPDAVVTRDADGHTPLVLLLLTPRGPIVGSRTDADISRMVRLMLSACPGASNLPESRCATPARERRVTIRPTNFANSGSSALLVQRGASQRNACQHRKRAAWKDQTGSREVGNPVPLYHAILHGRSTDTILLLLRDYQACVGTSPGCQIVTAHNEVLLHVAVTTRAPQSILYHLVNDCPSSVLARDGFGLNSIDWLWIRYCLDWQQSSEAVVPLTRIISRRRVLPVGFQDWYRRALNHITQPPSSSGTTVQSPSDTPFPSATVPVNPVALRNLQEDLLHRVKLLVPAAASACANSRLRGSASFIDSTKFQTIDSKGDLSRHSHLLSLLHATCFVPCPVALVHAALCFDHPATVGPSLRSPDTFMRRLPVHYAASRLSYVACLPTGAASLNLQVVREDSPVLTIAEACPEACGVVDGNGQLPLHVAIDTYKQKELKYPISIEGAEKSSEETPQDDEVSQEILLEGLQVFQALLRHYPGALERRDGRTGLLPFQQAAMGRGSSTTFVYALLRASPTSISTSSGICLHDSCS